MDPPSTPQLQLLFCNQLLEQTIYELWDTWLCFWPCYRFVLSVLWPSKVLEVNPQRCCGCEFVGPELRYWLISYILHWFGFGVVYFFPFLSSSVFEIHIILALLWGFSLHFFCHFILFHFPTSGLDYFIHSTLETWTSGPEIELAAEFCTHFCY